MKLSRIRQIIKEELEVVQSTLKEGGGFFDDSTQEEEAEAAEISAATSGEPFKDVTEDLGESNAADAADELTGRVPDAGAQMLQQSIEDLLDPESEFYEGLSGEELERAMPSPIVRNVLETLYNFIMGGRMDEAADSDEKKEKLPRVTSKDIDRLRRTHTGDYKRHQSARKKMSK
tara:strand:- start:145 stop:669 length:525 start_codon:yes stop_codon:yes gene_type:complete